MSICKYTKLMRTIGILKEICFHNINCQKNTSSILKDFIPNSKTGGYKSVVPCFLCSNRHRLPQQCHRANEGLRTFGHGLPEVVDAIGVGGLRTRGAVVCAVPLLFY